VALILSSLCFSAFAGVCNSVLFKSFCQFCQMVKTRKGAGNKFQFGARLYHLGGAAGRASELIGTIHPSKDY
jgi:hypothetical protein